MGTPQISRGVKLPVPRRPNFLCRAIRTGWGSRPASNTTVLKSFFADRSPTTALVACHRWLVCMEVIPFFKSKVKVHRAGSVRYGEYAGSYMGISKFC